MIYLQTSLGFDKRCLDEMEEYTFSKDDLRKVSIVFGGPDPVYVSDLPHTPLYLSSNRC